MDWFYGIAVLVSSIAAVLAWSAKILWSKEYKEATNRLIQAKDAEIALLKTQTELSQSFTSDKLQQILRATREELEEGIERLERKIAEKDKELERLKASGEIAADRIRELSEQKAKDEGGIIQLQHALITIGNTAGHYINVKQLMNNPIQSRKIERQFVEILKSTIESKSVDGICVFNEDSVTRRLLSSNELVQKLKLPIITISRLGELHCEVNSAKRILFIDDLLSSGLSLQKVIKIVQSRGAKVVGALVLIDTRRVGRNAVPQEFTIPIQSLLVLKLSATQAEEDVPPGRPYISGFPIQTTLTLKDEVSQQESSEPSVSDDA